MSEEEKLPPDIFYVTICPVCRKIRKGYEPMACTRECTGMWSPITLGPYYMAADIYELENLYLKGLKRRKGKAA
jgi:hypothetical protein